MSRPLFDLTALQPDEIDHIKHLLVNLLTNLKSRRALGGSGGLVTDEEVVYSALTHPERGDVVVIVLRGKKLPQIFLGNRREEDAPLAVMDKAIGRKYPGRRPLAGRFDDLKDDEVHLFLITIQDREMLHNAGDERVDLFSVHFGLADVKPMVTRPGDELKNRRLEECSLADRWEIFNRQWEADSRLPAIEKDLFGFQFTYARYKQPAKEEILMFTPSKWKPHLGQLVRDMYPYNVRKTLRESFPKEHAEKLKQTHASLQGLATVIKERCLDTHPEGYLNFLKMLAETISSIEKNDPELSGFT